MKINNQALQKKRILFLAITDKEGTDNRMYSNFVYFLCKQAMKSNTELMESYDITEFKRHDMMTFDNTRLSVYSCIYQYDFFIVLLDVFDNKTSFPPNVWFELGLASTQNKPILLISQEDVMLSPPFYVNDVNIIPIKKDLMDILKKEDYKNIFKNDTKIINEQIQLNFIEEANDLTSKNKQAVKAFCSNVCKRIKTAQNPFIHTNEHIQIKKTGFNNLEELFSEKGILNMLNDNRVYAEFIDGEAKAFKCLTQEVKKAQKSLRTSRFANQSIVAGQRKNSTEHNEFMKALCEASKRIDICDRIICNNEPQKWNDVQTALLDGGINMRIFLRKEEYDIGFELVIIDEEVAFIHFYQLDKSGDTNSDGSTVYQSDTKIINSTLKISGHKVCSRLADIFDRLHHRDFNTNKKDPSRTLLGIPRRGDINGYEDNGVIQYDVSPSDNIEHDRNEKLKRTRAINKLLFERFHNWYKEMSEQDKKNMALGISSLDNKYAKIILDNLDTYFSKDSNIINDVRTSLTNMSLDS